jgi:hypothetical protein
LDLFRHDFQTVLECGNFRVANVLFKQTIDELARGNFTGSHSALGGESIDHCLVTIYEI